jgi:chemotaxis protein methyltransferase CheR
MPTPTNDSKTGAPCDATPARPENGSEMADLLRLLDAIFEHRGVDFRDYALSSLKRRVMRRVAEERTVTISGLRDLVVADPVRMEDLIVALTIHTTSMFRDPAFYLVLREQIVSVLRTYPFLRLWVAGCSTGQEVYSLAILLHETGLYPRCRIYATDMNEVVLNKAKAGIFPLSVMQEYTRNYLKAGGDLAFTEYYTADSESVVFRSFLRENVVFAAHNLTGDASFNEFHGIFCRNVMIYFNRALQDRVHKLFHDSLVMLGYLGLGRSESIRFSSWEDSYEAVSAKERLYRKIK